MSTNLSEGQRLAHMGSWAFNAAGFEYWSSELFRIHGLDPHGKPPSANEGGGATFHFTLPIQATESSPLVA
jgi:hypothetical protein